jgi:hypothetical protein
MLLSVPVIAADDLKAGAHRVVHHYVFFGRDRERISEASFVDCQALEGAQLKYLWRELEKEEGVYDFSAIEADLAALKSNGKKLFVQLQDSTFDPHTGPVPKYLMKELFGGGAARQYSVEGKDEEHATAAGWVARRWDPAVRERFHKLLEALGKQFDGRIEGINLPETAVDFGESGKLFPAGFKPEEYGAAIISNMAALKRAFPRSVTMQYANFMPGEWLPGDDHAYLRSIYEQARALHVGVGGPDLLPYKPGQMNHAYPLIRASAGKVPSGIAVQDGNFEHKNPKTGARLSVAEMCAFAAEYLQVDYVFWGTQEPFYSDAVIPYLRAMR